MNASKSRVSVLLLIMVCSLPMMAQEKKADQTMFTAYATHDMITIQPVNQYASSALVVQGGDIHYARTLTGKQVPFIDTFDKDGFTLPDGQYAFELKAIV